MPSSRPGRMPADQLPVLLLWLLRIGTLLLHLPTLSTGSKGEPLGAMCKITRSLTPDLVALREHLTDDDDDGSISFISLKTKHVACMSADERCALSERILAFYLDFAFRQSIVNFTVPQRSKIVNGLDSANKSLRCACKFNTSDFSRKSKKMLQRIDHATESSASLRRAFRDMELISRLCPARHHTRRKAGAPRKCGRQKTCGQR